MLSNQFIRTTEKAWSLHKLKLYLSFCTYEKLSLPHQGNRTPWKCLRT